MPVITRESCGSRPWKKWPQPGNTMIGSSCGRAQANTSASAHDVVLLAVDDDRVGGHAVDGEAPDGRADEHHPLGNRVFATRDTMNAPNEKPASTSGVSP